MESLYHLHPIFEFLLTVYFGFIIAPEFFGRFLLEKIPFFLEVSRENALTSLNKIIEKLNKAEQELNETEQDFKQHDLGEVIISDFLPSLEKSKEQVNEIIEKIKKDAKEIEEAIKLVEEDSIMQNEEAAKSMLAKIEMVKTRLSKSTRKCYDHVFPFASFYCLLILIFNGCHWAKLTPEHDTNFLSFLSFFNALSFFYLSLLILFRRLIDSISNADNVNLSSYRLRHSIYAIIAIMIISFWLVPNLNNPYFYKLEEIQFRLLTIFSSVFIASYALLFFGYDLSRRNSRKYFEIKYRTEIKGAQLGVNIAISEFEGELYQNMKSFNKIKKSKGKR